MRKITRRSFLAAAAACGAAAALTACGGSSASSAAASSAAPASSAAASAAADGQKFTIGICQLVQHAALDAATQGFEDALTASFGENVTFDFQNAQGDSATCATITNGFVSAGVDLIMANATPALQAAQSATNTIPVLVRRMQAKLWQALYFNYDYTQLFLPQLERNLNWLNAEIVKLTEYQKKQNGKSK